MDNTTELENDPISIEHVQTETNQLLSKYLHVLRMNVV